MQTRFKARCERVRKNNGIVEALFKRHADFSDQKSQEETVLVNVMIERGQYEENKDYWILIQPAFPH